jgi:predicted nucleic acid-binding protein
MGSPLNPSSPRVYLDANVFIAALESPTARSDHAWWILRAIQAGEIAGVTSEITLAEVLVKPIELGMQDMIVAYENMVAPAPNFDVPPVTREILIDAARIRARRASVRLPDAVHLATARSRSCTFFVTEDRRMEILEGMKQLIVNPFTLDDILSAAE